MYNKTYKTMDKYPLVYLIAIPTVIIKILSYIFFGFGAKHLTSIPQLISTLSSLSQGEIAFFVLIGILSSGLLFLLVYPSVLNYIYNACNDNIKKGWYKHGLKRNTLRMLPLFIIFLLSIALWLAFLLIPIYDSGVPVPEMVFASFALLISIILMNIQIGAVSVVAEEKVGDSIKAFFKFSIDIFVPLYGTHILFGIPIRLLKHALEIGFLEPIKFLQNFSSLFTEYTTNKIVFSIIIYVIWIIAEVFTTTFIYTYLTHKYIAERQEYYENKKKESEPDLITSNP